MTKNTHTENTPQKVRTAILLLNMGGPADLDAVHPFLLNLFEDRDLMRLPFQDTLGPFIAKMRSPKVRKTYEQIGGRSPILLWTQEQGQGLTQRLDREHPESAPHKAYVAFRYSAPGVEKALDEMVKDGVERAIAFSQYPHFSCATSGSSFNELWEAVVRRKLNESIEWSTIDRWFDSPDYIDAVANTITEGLERFDPLQRKEVVVLFSSHSLPLSVVDRGDAYPSEVASTLHAIVARLKLQHRFVPCFQSAVGPVRWQGPDVHHVIEGLAKGGSKYLLLVPLGFTSDHIETLYELDILYAEVAERAGIVRYERAASMNARPDFIDALSNIVLEHLRGDRPCAPRYQLRCPGCPGDCTRLDPNMLAVANAIPSPTK